MDRCLAGQMEVEQKASMVVDEVRHLKDLISSTQEAMLRAKQRVEEAERKTQDFEH